MINKIQVPKSTHQHSHHHESEDSCEGCQEERRQNNMLVDFYERLAKIETKVDKIKDNVNVQQTMEMNCREGLATMSKLLLKKPDEALKIIKGHDPKEMGYELASALIEREIKTKMENQRLQSIIQQLQKEKMSLEEEKKRHSTRDTQASIHFTAADNPLNTAINSNNLQIRYGDVLDEVRRTNDSSYFLPKKKDMSSSYFLEETGKKYWEEAGADQEQTSFSNFTAALKKEKRQPDEKQYQGLNLWLYQFKPEEIDQNPIKSLRRPPNQKKVSNPYPKYKSKF